MTQIHEHHRPTERRWNVLIPEQLCSRLVPAERIGDAVFALGAAVLDTLGGRKLELVALRVGALRASQYVWCGHCVTSRWRPDGTLTMDEIARVAAGPRMLAGDDALVTQAVDDLLQLGRFGARTREGLGDQAVGIHVAILFYDMLASLMDGAEPDVAPVPGLETPALAASMAGRLGSPEPDAS